MQGYFLNNEFVITDMFAKRLLLNYIWNNKIIVSCDQFGNGYAEYIFDGKRRGFEGRERNVYIKDCKTGEYFSANRNYKKQN